MQKLCLKTKDNTLFFFKKSQKYLREVTQQLAVHIVKIQAFRIS